jgi:hypothetical protein
MKPEAANTEARENSGLHILWVWIRGSEDVAPFWSCIDRRFGGSVEGIKRVRKLLDGY